MLITISRQYGAGGSRGGAAGGGGAGLARGGQRARRTGGRARRARRRRTWREREERAHFIERLARTLAAATPRLVRRPGRRRYRGHELAEADLVRVTEAVVAEIAAEGRVVLVGRAAPAVLAPRADALHVKVVAPRDYRIRVAAERLGCQRRRGGTRSWTTPTRTGPATTEQYYRRDWDDPANYHMVLNTGRAGARRGGGGDRGREGAGALTEGRAEAQAAMPRSTLRSGAWFHHPNEIPPFPYPGSRRSGFARV